MAVPSKSVLVTAIFLCASGCASQSEMLSPVSAEAYGGAAIGRSEPADSATQADHDLASTGELRDAEQVACAQVSDTDRELGPFARKERIVAVEPLKARAFPEGFLQPSGIAVYMRATPGVTVESLDRALECHMARHAVLGSRMPDRNSPLFVADARIALSSYGDGFRIAITTRDIAAAREVIERGRTLVE